MTDDAEFIFYRKPSSEASSEDSDKKDADDKEINSKKLYNSSNSKTLDLVIRNLSSTSEVSQPWMMILGDLLSLILSFFILLYIDIMPTQKLWDNIVASVNLRHNVKNFHEIENNMKKVSEMPKVEGIKNVYLEQVIKNHIENYEGKFIAEVYSDIDGIIVSAPEKEIFLLNEYVDDEAKDFISFLSTILFNMQKKLKVRTYIHTEDLTQQTFIDRSNKCLRIVKFLRNATTLDNINCELKYTNGLGENSFEIIISN
ncbi:MAG: hypothetical protein J0G32_07995 [Alphaproteobacteria bacterium]|nr:hypothetical protein [Alphaproteobacteria bacterium]OJV15837.1 MAG: hypothetical protein BGO27_07990 [Alphaproteobacteria bacterium 33-17]